MRGHQGSWSRKLHHKIREGMFIELCDEHHKLPTQPPAPWWTLSAQQVTTSNRKGTNTWYMPYNTCQVLTYPSFSYMASVLIVSHIPTVDSFSVDAVTCWARRLTMAGGRSSDGSAQCIWFPRELYLGTWSFNLKAPATPIFWDSHYHRIEIRIPNSVPLATFRNN